MMDAVCDVLCYFKSRLTFTIPYHAIPLVDAVCDVLLTVVGQTTLTMLVTVDIRPTT